jgi:hypothetical protein
VAGDALHQAQLIPHDNKTSSGRDPAGAIR